MKGERVMCGEYAEAKYAAHLARLFGSLSNPANLRVLLALGDDEVSVNHLADILELAPPDVQKRLDDFEELDLVCGTLYGQVRLFRMKDARLRDLLFERLGALTEA